MYGSLKTFRRDIDPAFKSIERREFCTASGVNLTSGLLYMHTTTRLVERSIQTTESLKYANLESGHCSKENFGRAKLVHEVYNRYNKNEKTVG